MPLAYLFGATASALAALGSLWIFALMLLICGDIAGRALFNTPIPGTPELVALSVPGIVFLQLAQVVRARRMIHADLILRVIAARAPLAGRLYGLLFALAGLAVFVFLLLWAVPDLATAVRRGSLPVRRGRSRSRSGRSNSRSRPARRLRRSHSPASHGASSRRASVPAASRATERQARPPPSLRWRCSSRSRRSTSR
ncbi:MAG: TRAP transporter small permease [Burkholderiales bacterium]|nr:TRAP transporter small permease [Burkholderiales bacterium]